MPPPPPRPPPLGLAPLTASRSSSSGIRSTGSAGGKGWGGGRMEWDCAPWVKAASHILPQAGQGGGTRSSPPPEVSPSAASDQKPEQIGPETAHGRPLGVGGRGS